MIRVWSINGSLYLTRSACPSSENILSCIYYEVSAWNGMPYKYKADLHWIVTYF